MNENVVRTYRSSDPAWRHPMRWVFRRRVARLLRHNRPGVTRCAHPIGGLVRCSRDVGHRGRCAYLDDLTTARALRRRDRVVYAVTGRLELWLTGRDRPTSYAVTVRTLVAFYVGGALNVTAGPLLALMLIAQWPAMAYVARTWWRRQQWKARTR